MYAFPSGHNPKTGTQESGMTLRDYMAAKAMQALISEDDGRFPIDQVVRAAWQYADEMLKARDL